METLSAEELGSYERAKAQLAHHGLADRVIMFPVSSATVELAAQALGCDACRIAKTLSFKSSLSSHDGGCILLVTAGDTRTDNQRFRECFGVRPKMLSASEVVSFTGHAVGGVCPFGISGGSTDVKVFLDASLRRFEFVFPACGTHNTGVKLTPDELERCSGCVGWVDVCKGWRTGEDIQKQTPTPMSTPMSTPAGETPTPTATPSEGK